MLKLNDLYGKSILINEHRVDIIRVSGSGSEIIMTSDSDNIMPTVPVSETVDEIADILEAKERKQ